MLTLYGFCFVIGGIFVALSALAGFDGVEFDHSFDTDIEIIDKDNNETKSTFSRQRRSNLWLPWLSLKFWTFGSCFFGLTGIALSLLQPQLSALTVVILSLTIGIICGTSIVSVLHRLRHNQANSLVRLDDLVGLCGTVEIPFDNNTKGKIRLNVKGSQVDFVALTENTNSFNPGDKVVVVGMENNKLWVVAEDSLRNS